MNINNLLSGGPPSKPPPPPPPPSQAAQQPQQLTHHQVQQHQQQSLPSTPVQTMPPQSFRDYGNPPQASPTRGLSQEYGAHQMQQSAQYGSPQAYQQQQPPYAGRPGPPPLQPLSGDMRSPGAASIPGPGPSPYRPTPTSSISSASGGYPFPPPQQVPVSPGQRHQYPPTSGYPGREGYAQPGGPSSASGANPYSQAPSMPQTPPVGTPGGTHPYLQQRPSSTYSATPTSATAHQQPQQYGAPFGSPLATTHPPPPYPEFGRQQSQPPTPLGPPPRQPSVPLGYAQPSSPYQQRVSSTGSGYPSNLIHHPQASPSAPAPPSIPRVPSNHSIYDNPVRAESSRGSRSQSERDRSLSVSPKTRIPSLPSSSSQYGRPSLPESEARTNPTSASSMHAAPSSSLETGRTMERFDRATTPGKRKLDDRDLAREELEKRDVRPPPFETPNGYVSKPEPDTLQVSQPSGPPARAAPKRRVRYATVPIWAQTYREGLRLNRPNFVLRKPGHNVGTQANGKTGSAPKSQLASRQTSPEEKRSVGPPATVPPRGAVAPQAPVDELPNESQPLGPWESCISGTAPANEVATTVADFLFLNVVRNPDIGEISSRNVQFEIEAKVGILINKDTDERVNLPILTECVLDNTNGRVAFQSNMSEAQHKAFNEYFNELVRDTHPMRPAFDQNGVPRVSRVPIMYKHRRETDKFFELSPSLRKQLPACIQHRIPAKHSAKVRVTYDQSTRGVIAKIIKARVADLDLHMPRCPFDCRISVNLEMDWDGTVEELEREATVQETSPDRKKDRLSYTQSHYQIDLTQVTHTVTGLHNAQQLKKDHEIEIEVSANAIIDQGRRAESGQPHQYDLLVEGLVNNVRHLARKARQFAGH